LLYRAAGCNHHKKAAAEVAAAYKLTEVEEVEEAGTLLYYHPDYTVYYYS
jgi:hypothetical protein